jgi:hypothetical protein
MSIELDVVIEGVPDVRVAKAIKRRIREVCDADGRSGEWSVLVSPSESRGQWDLGVRGPGGRCFLSFAGGDAVLPDVVAAQLRECLSAT